ncbi:MAG TPA: PEGA domain-containing protein, partial [Anaeromyxobacteraceae bacterium]|nr:PEGA domain-containing protein [Anaeromyxobacteraceae bacterium]
ATDRAAVRAAMKRLEQKLAATGIQVLIVYTDPPGADVRVEGRVRGKTPFHLALPPGAYALHLEREGVAPLAREVTIPPDASVTVDAVLPKLSAPAAASLDSAPASRALRSGGTGEGEATPKAGLSPPSPAALAGGALSAVPVDEAPKPAVRAKGRVWTWVAAGTAVVAASAGAYYGSKARDAESTLLDGTARTDARVLADDAKKRSRTANVLYGVAGAAAATGVTLFFVEGRF